MKIRTQHAGQSLSRSEFVVGFVFDRGTPNLGADLTDFVARCKATGDVDSSARTLRVFHRDPKNAKKEPKRLGLIGMGAQKAVSTELLRRAAAVVQQRAESIGVASVDLVLDAFWTDFGSGD